MYEDPFDRTRPLWLIVTIDGVEGGRTAMFSKLHHTLSDGISALRLSELYIDRERIADPPPDVDLDAVFAAALEQQSAEVRESGPRRNVAPWRRRARRCRTSMRRQVGVTRRAVGTMASWSTDPRRALDAGQKAVDGVRSTIGQVSGGGDRPGGAPLWTNALPAAAPRVRPGATRRR